MSERQWLPQDTDDTATQQLPRVQPPLPGSLDPVRREPASAPATETSSEPMSEPMSEPAHDSTAVLSLDDLMGPPQPAPSAPVVTPVAPPPAPVPQVRPTSQSRPAAPAPSPPAPAPTGPSVAERVRGDAAAAWAAGLRRSRTWLSVGDNAVIAATALVALLLLVMVAAL